MSIDLKRVPIPGEADAEERAWTVISRAFGEQEPRPVSRRRGRLALVASAATLTAALVAVAVSPAGSEIVHSVREAVGLKKAAPALIALPASGRLLVSSAEGPWIVQADGTKRLLGHYREASWSPHGLYIAVTSGHQLLAVDPHGTVRWSIARPGTISLPRWSPDGYRIAYFDGTGLRIVNGDGTGDHAVPGAVVRVAPAWRPSDGHQHVLAYVLVFTAHGEKQVRLVAFDADTHELYADRRLPALPLALLWSADGKRLVAVAPNELSVFDHNGKPLGTIRLQRRAVSAALAPGGHRLAVILAGTQSSTVVFDLDLLRRPPQQVFGGSGSFNGLAWSPDGNWLLLAWQTADQWLFVHVAPRQRITAVSAIASQFNPGHRRASFPTLDGWCC